MPSLNRWRFSNHPLVIAALSLTLSSCSSLTTTPRWDVAPGPELSEDPVVAMTLAQALDDFLESLAQGEIDAVHTDEVERNRHPFFYRSLVRGTQDARPIVLKSYPNEDGSYQITIAFVVGPTEGLRIPRIAEFVATPVDGSYRFACPYDRKIAELRHHEIGSVIFHFANTLDERRATQFVKLKERLERLMGREPAPLDYDCFESLEALLRTFGLVHDASKCNFLRCDLGFLWNDGRRYSTGTGDPAYAFGYVRGALVAHATNPDECFGPWVNGVAAYYGGYGLSGESVDVLANQFREELAHRPDVDFLAEFKKGRESSVRRHFSHYVMCAFLCRAIVERHGEAAALELVECGANGERFFAALEQRLGVTEANFHTTIVDLIHGH